MAGKSIFYWDTCIFLAWFKDENRPNGEIEGVNAIAEMVHRNHAILVTSTIIEPEILKSTLNEQALQRFENLFKRKNFRKIAADSRVMKLSAEIRDFYKQQGNNRLKTPDAIHLASAILYAANEFHTFDEALLSLSGNVAEHLLKICKPPLPAQRGLFLK